MMGPAVATFEVVSFVGNGELSWSEHPDMVRYKVQWASSLEGQWYDSWDMLKGIEAKGSDQTVLVPMFYRDVGVDAHTVLMIHGDAEPGSNPITDEMGHGLLIKGDTRVSTDAFRFGGAASTSTAAGITWSRPSAMIGPSGPAISPPNSGSISPRLPLPLAST